MLKALLILCIAVSLGYSADSAGCWLHSYGRGVGKPISTCPSGEQKDAALCYPECKSGYDGVGPVCWQSCPDGFKDTGLDCLKPSSYGRGAGYVLWDKKKCEKAHSQGCEKSGLLWYPNCNEGFHAAGCCICSPDCPDDMTDIGVSCARKSYGRGAGHPLVCASGEEEDAALCYTPCNSGYHGVGPVCWGSCPEGYTSCGALCLLGESCAGKILSLGQSGLKGVAEIAAEAEDPVADVVNTLKVVGDLAGGLDYPLCSSPSSSS